MSETDLLFSDAEAPLEDGPAIAPWNILIVDDDQEVHLATKLVMSDVSCLGRPLRFYSAYSGAEARQLLPELEDLAIILLDVVMEADDAGLKLVRHIREVLDMQTTRIILRTGQPGSAPERSVIVQYDINDYKAKTELTDARLFTSIIAALRSYRHLVSLETSRLGLRKVIDAAASLHQSRSLQMFADGVLLQLTAILESASHSILCTHRSFGDTGHMIMLASSGRFRDLAAYPSTLECEDAIKTRVRHALDRRCHQFDDIHAALYLRTPTAREVVVYIENDRPFSELDLSLLELFGHNISVGYDNLEMYQQLCEANADLEARVVERTMALSMSEADLRRFKSAVDHSSASILITDSEGIITYANPAMSRTSMYAPEELLGERPSLFKSGKVPVATFKTLWECISGGENWRGELLNRRKNGDLYWEDVSISPVADEAGKLTHFVAVKDDISERKKLEDELRRMATIDPLTSVLNRRSFFDLADREIARHRRYAGLLSAIMLDVDHFKTVNDRFGHQAGDEVLRIVASVCSAVLEDCGTIGRMGGEEFACILPDVSQAEAMAIAERLRAAVANTQAVMEDCDPVNVTISIGVASLIEADQDFDDVLRRADAALYRAKQAGRNLVCELG